MDKLQAGDHLDPTDEISLEIVKGRAVKGVVALVGRFGILYAISIVAQIFLSVFLTPTEWGVFALVSAVVNFLVYFSDIGLAASLIQSKEKLTDRDLKTTFTVQQILVGAILIIIFLASPYVQASYGLTREGVFLLYALGASLFMSSLKTIPSVLLERQIEFEKIALASILENLAYNIVLVVLAWQGFGVASFAWAVLARGTIGLTALYLLKPWKPGFAFSKASLKKLLSFGLPYQLNTFIAVAKDDGLVIILGKILGLEAMGILSWAQKWAQFPLRIFLDSVTKVTFPAFSRMQDSRAHLEQAVTRSVFFISLLVFPLVSGLVIVAPVLIHVIPRFERWEPAMIPLALVAVNVMFASVTTQLTNLLNAIGKIKTTFKLMLMWAGLTWLFLPYLSTRFGVNGAALGYALVGTSSVVAIYIVKRYVNFSLWEGVGKTLLATLAMVAATLFVRSITPISTSGIILMVTTGALVYSSLIYALVGSSLLVDVKKIVATFAKK